MLLWIFLRVFKRKNIRKSTATHIQQSENQPTGQTIGTVRTAKTRKRKYYTLFDRIDVQQKRFDRWWWCLLIECSFRANARKWRMWANSNNQAEFIQKKNARDNTEEYLFVRDIDEGAFIELSTHHTTTYHVYSGRPCIFVSFIPRGAFILFFLLRFE